MKAVVGIGVADGLYWYPTDCSIERTKKHLPCRLKDNQRCL